MELLGYWWPPLKYGKGRGHDDGFT